MKILSVVGSPRGESLSAAALLIANEAMSREGATVHVIDLRTMPLPFYTPDTFKDAEHYPLIAQLATEADAFLLATPDYHGSMSGALKNFLDYFWLEFTGKLFGYVCASHEKGITAMDQMRTVVRQCYGWSLPYGVSLAPKDAENNVITNPQVVRRLEMVGRDLVVYGKAIRQQRKQDLEDRESNTFLARYRGKIL